MVIKAAGKKVFIIIINNYFRKVYKLRAAGVILNFLIFTRIKNLVLTDKELFINLKYNNNKPYIKFLELKRK